MRRRRPATLLDFAIGASIAVVPVLLAVLLAVAWLRPPDAASPGRAGDRHVSVRQVAALKTFEHAIVRRDRVGSGPPTPQALLAGLPACRGEWDTLGDPMQRLRRLLAPASDARPRAEIVAAQLGRLDDALRRFSTGANRRVSEAVGLDGQRWIEAAAAALQTPVEAEDYPGQRFAVQCTDLASAVAALVRSEARMLGSLAWRGTEVPQTIARWRADQFVEISGRQLARANPWGGVAGCVYLGRAAPGASSPIGGAYFVAQSRGIAARVCAQPQMHGLAGESGGRVAPTGIVGEPAADTPVGDERWNVPPSLDAMLRSLAALQRPSGAAYRLYNGHGSGAEEAADTHRGTPDRVVVDGAPIDVGLSIDLTIDPTVQRIAQQTAACYTGRQDVCRALEIRRSEDAAAPIGHRLLERAVVRMAAVAVVDVASGRIEALAGALSPCTRHEYDGPGRGANCDPRIPYPIRYRPDALLNPAVFHDAMPASTIKPIMAAAFLADTEVGARWLAAERVASRPAAWPARDSLRGQLMRSDSARFLDRMFCAERNFENCRRAWDVQQTAAAFGWNAGCDKPRDDCGKRDLLFGRAGDADPEALLVGLPATIVPYGRLLVEPASDAVGAPVGMRRATPLDVARVRACAAGPDGRRPSRDDWEQCRGKVVVDVVAEGWGQGNARSSALGIAGMMAALAAAANGEPARAPHLVDAVRGAGASGATLFDAASRPDLTPAAQGRLSRDAAALILDALSYSHRGGTARRACEQVFDPRSCRDIDWIAGKTGTPTFPNDDASLDDLARECARPGVRSRREEAACGALRPYKWYVAAYRTDPADARWSKAIGVLTERNWVTETGRIHGAGDHGPNPAAEIALQIAARHVGHPTGDAR